MRRKLRAQTHKDSDSLGFLNTLRIRTLVAQAETITPLGDLTDFAELAGRINGAKTWPPASFALR